EPVLSSGRDALVPVILDGENAWEYYPASGREFLRHFYDALGTTPGVEAVTMSEAIARHRDKNELTSLVPGSWIHANFNVWIGAPEDNRAWDYLYHAREFYAQNAARASAEQRKLAFQELLIAEGSDWNWWYGPEHHSANDREFDALYRKHLSNVYQALGATPPDYLAQPISGGSVSPTFVPQSAYIHPSITGDMVRYFEWMGAAHYTADRRDSAMHGKQFFLDAAYAGIDESNVYGRLDFCEGSWPGSDFDLVVYIESWFGRETRPRTSLRLNAAANGKAIKNWKISGSTDEMLATSDAKEPSVRVVLRRNFEFKLPLMWLGQVRSGMEGDGSAGGQLRLRFSLWLNGLPADALPVEGWIELPLISSE